jgi:deazaflavin-dependent oxidoreductase (nitroreductase family)
MAERSGGPGKAIGRTLMRVMVWLYRRSGGRIAGTMKGAPVLLITSTGRRSGRSWTTPVIYQPDGDGWVVIASNGGSPQHPAWWLNLRAKPESTIEIGRDSYPVTARSTTGEERERLWQKMIGVYPGYDGYTKKTTRLLPVVKLDRR